MSLKPGIGAAWFKKYGSRDVYANDYVIADGGKKRPPRFYDKLEKRADPLTIGELKATRELNATHHAENNTRERLKVRERVQLARIEHLYRKDNDV